MKNLNNILKFIKIKTEEFEKSPILEFKDLIKPNWRPKQDGLEFPGVYIIYEKGLGTIYVGSAGKGKHYLKHRISDLFQSYQKNKYKHYLTKKLIEKIKRFRTIHEIQQFYLRKCYVKVVETETVRRARILEYVLIETLDPKYNQ